MNYIIKNCRVFDNSEFIKRDVRINGCDSLRTCEIILNEGCIAVPSFVDAHVHLREPGFSYKETIKTGTASAARGGYSTVFSMPNLNPPPDCFGGIEAQLSIIKRDAVVNVIPVGCLSKDRAGERLSSMDEIAPYIAGFSDDGSGLQSEALMEKAMRSAKKLNKPIIAHCEDVLHVAKGGSINECDYAKKHGLIGISAKSEWMQVERDIELVRKTGCRYHVCHVSTKESVEIIRKAKRDGLQVTAETAPHYLVLNDGMLINEGRFKMNPPIRGEADRLALIEGLLDNTIDIIATDHAPHSEEEKSKELRDSAMGISGLETAFPILYTKLVLNGILSIEKLIELMSVNPRKIFNLPSDSNITVIDLNAGYAINSADFYSKGKATPFDGVDVFGKVLITFINNAVVYYDQCLQRQTTIINII